MHGDLLEHEVSLERLEQPLRLVPVAAAYEFFFQAEAGIRDIGVTGVQTCALPIWPAHDLREDLLGARHLRHPLGVYETRRLNPRETRGSQFVAQLRPDLRREPSVFVLQAVAGSDVDYLYAHSDHPSLAQAFPLLLA